MYERKNGQLSGSSVVWKMRRFSTLHVTEKSCIYKVQWADVGDGTWLAKWPHLESLFRHAAWHFIAGRRRWGCGGSWVPYLISNTCGLFFLFSRIWSHGDKIIWNLIRYNIVKYISNIFSTFLECAPIGGTVVLHHSRCWRYQFFVYFWQSKKGFLFFLKMKVIVMKCRLIMGARWGVASRVSWRNGPANQGGVWVRMVLVWDVECMRAFFFPTWPISWIFIVLGLWNANCMPLVITGREEGGGRGTARNETVMAQWLQYDRVPMWKEGRDHLVDLKWVHQAARYSNADWDVYTVKW